LVVKYRRESTRVNGDISKFMHFHHEQGAKKLHRCHDPVQINHLVACEALKRKLQKQEYCSPEYKVCREFAFDTPSGNPYKADIAVLRSGRLIKIYEIQRTYRGLRELKRKTEDVSDVCEIEWIIFAGSYRQMTEQRYWLSSVGKTYWKLFFDDFKIKLEPGKPPKNRGKSVHHKEPKSSSNGCLQGSEFGWDELPDTLSLSQIQGVEFIGSRGDDTLTDKPVENKSLILERVWNSNRLEPEISEAKKYTLLEGSFDMVSDNLDPYKKFIVGRNIIGRQGEGIITAVDFIFRKVLVRRGAVTEWVPFDGISIYE
jgi:hypothetical protein